MSWICTHTGGRFDIFDPKPEAVRIEDIAHALAMNCRYNGHTDHFFSVAEHCIVASMFCDPEFALEVLLHDAAEAYLSDIPKPIKMRWPEFSAHEDVVLRVIFEGLGVTWPDLDVHAHIKYVDLRMLATEKPQVLPRAQDDWDILEGVYPYPHTFAFLEPRHAAGAFLNHFNKLSMNKGGADG